MASANRQRQVSETSPIVCDNEADKTGCCSTARTCLSVEPLAFFYTLAYVLSNSTSQQYATYYFADEQYRNNVSILSESLCDMSTSDSEWLGDVESLSGNYLTGFSLLNYIPMLFTAVLVGSYSDSNGRKIVMFAPVVGGILRGLATVLVVHFQWNIYFMYIGAGVEGFLGGPGVFSVALYAYVADVTANRQRSWHMLLLLVAEATGIGLAEVTDGYIIASTGFLWPFVSIVFVYAFTFALILLYVHETVSVKIRTSYFSVRHLLRTVGLLLSAEDPQLLWVLRLSSFITLLSFLVEGIVTSCLYLYVSQPPLCFTWVQVGYLAGFTCIVQMVFGTWVFRRLYPHLGDSGLLAIGSISGILSRGCLAIPVMNVYYIFIVPVIGFMAFAVTSLARALMSKSVGPGEQGAVQSIAAVATVLGNLIGQGSATAVYAVTVNIYSGTIFCVAVIVYTITFTCALVFMARIPNIPKFMAEYKRQPSLT